MKLRLCSSILLSGLTTFASAKQHAPVPPVEMLSPGKFYVGIFGGGGSSSNHLNVNQTGTAFFTEAQGGPLAVNALGQLNSKSSGFIGAQVGYQLHDIDLLYTQWALAPAAELEAYAMYKSTFGATLHNETDRLDEHDFLASYPMKRNVFLVNALLNFNYNRFPVNPYIGLGFGSANVKVTDAIATQTNPPEDGINHYNSNTQDTITTFAGQFKLGLSYDIYDCITIFADYRRLYLADTHFTLGSTIYPTHVPTSTWLITLDPQKYNLWNVGIRINW